MRVSRSEGLHLEVRLCTICFEVIVMQHTKMVRMVFTGLLTALVCVATMVIKIPTPTNGYVNIGDAMVLLCGWLLGPAYGFFAAGVGSALADLINGYGSYVAGTLLIKGLMGVTAALIMGKGRPLSRILGGILAEMLMVGGYFLYESILLGYGFAAVASIPGNAVQGGMGLIFGLLLYRVLEKTELTKF